MVFIVLKIFATFFIFSADPESTAVARLLRAEAYAALRQYHKALEDAEFCCRPEMLQRCSAEVGHWLMLQEPNKLQKLLWL